MLTRELEETLSYAVDEAVKHKHEFVTLEHLLFALLEDRAARDILFNCGAQIEEIAKSLEDYFNILASDIEPMPWAATSAAVRTAQIVAILEKGGVNRDEIRPPMFHFCVRR